jgi:PhnB protein
VCRKTVHTDLKGERGTGPADAGTASELPMSANHAPPGHHSVTPYLAVPNTRRAIAFYREAFGARELFSASPSDQVTAHAEIMIGDCVIQIHDDMPGVSRGRAPERLGGTTVSFTIFTEDVEAMLARGLAAGVTMDSPLETTYWGDRSVRVTDPFGHCWTLATHLETVSPEEQERRAKEHFARLGLLDLS